MSDSLFDKEFVESEIFMRRVRMQGGETIGKITIKKPEKSVKPDEAVEHLKGRSSQRSALGKHDSHAYQRRPG